VEQGSPDLQTAVDRTESLQEHPVVAQETPTDIQEVITKDEEKYPKPFTVEYGDNNNNSFTWSGPCGVLASPWNMERRWYNLC
jgi:hypothetical protein